MSSVREFPIRRPRSGRLRRRSASMVGSAVRAALGHVAEWVRQEYAFRRSTAALRELDDRLLADVGLIRVRVQHGPKRGEVVFEPDRTIWN